MSSARRVHNRLDWWRLDEWGASTAWSVAGTDGALLIAPTDLGAHDDLTMTRAGAAWLRWCAVADGHSASAVMRALFAESATRLRVCGLRSAWAIADASDWITPYLVDAGFAKVDRMLTYQMAAGAIRDEPTTPPLTVRRADEAILSDVIALDVAAFGEPWRYGRLLHRVYNQCSVFDVISIDGVLVGYVCALTVGERAHIVRLAVAEVARGRGIGTSLLAHSIGRLRRAGAKTLTLNTQHTNVASQRLYRRFGFQQMIEQPYVFRLELNDGAAGETA